jgi:23S rRNA (pseudouridine1915-N3)-methyltransferase
VKIRVLAVGRRTGRLKEPFWAAAEADYLARLRHHADVEVREVADDSALLAALPPRARLVALDARGELLSSEEIAHKVVAQAEQHGGGAPLAFAIGGADGLGPTVRARAERSLAFGRITLPHRLARLVLLEQLYRAYAILRGTPYHH